MPWHFWEDESRLTGVAKKSLCQKNEFCSDPISADPICPVPRYPMCQAVHEHVMALPSIQEYLASDHRFPFPAGEICERYVENVGLVLNGR